MTSPTRGRRHNSPLVDRPAVALVAALACGLAATALAQRPGPRDPESRAFSLGSTADEVRRAQGVPAVIERLHSLGVEIWTYGSASVRLSADSLRVVGWDNRAGVLHVVMRPGPNVTTSATVGPGSHRDDVVRLMGTPTAVRGDHARGTMVWSYGTRTVTIGVRDGRAIAVTNGDVTRRPESRGSPPAQTMSPADAVPQPPNAPANLSAALTFSEPSGNGALDGGETGTVTVVVANRGPGVAQGIRLSLVPDSGESAIEVAPTAPITRLDAGKSARVPVGVVARPEIRDGRVSLRLLVQEANGFDVEPARRLTIPVRASRPPRLALAGTRTEDQGGDGRIAPRELVEVTARVWNSGTGAARDVKASLTPGADTFLSEESPRELTLGTLAPGEHRDVTFVFYTNTRASDVRVVLALTEGSGRGGATLTLPFAIDRPLTQTLDVTVAEPAPVDRAAAAPAPPLDEIERDIPRAAEPNPDALAVVIGVERYTTLPSARFAARDAQLFRRYAASALGVPDDRNHIYLRTDAEATGNEFRKLFGDDGWVARRVRPTTDVYVYFSGHGSPDIKTRTPYLLPTDADAAYPRETGYALGELYRQLARLNARSITVLLDACFTGATRSNGTLFGGARPIVISVEQPALLRDNFAVIAASGGDEIASDFPAKRHGLFTYYALLGLRGAADADSNRTVTVGELERYLVAAVPHAAAMLDREQTPVVIARQKDRAIVRLGGSRE